MGPCRRFTAPTVLDAANLTHNETSASMPASTHVTLADYLSADYKPERALIQGELVGRPIDTLPQRRMEKRIARVLERWQDRGLGEVMWELSIRRGTDVRIPDLVFY